MKRNTQRQSGSVHLIIIIALVVVVVGLVAFVFWQNFVDKKDDVNSKQATSATETRDAISTGDDSTKTTTATNTPALVDNSNFVVIDTWGVKFTKPTDGTTVQWAVNEYGSIGFTTSNLPPNATNDSCSAYHAAAGLLERTTTKIDNSNSAGTTYTILNNNEPINGYYYEFASPQAPHCDSTNPTDEHEAIKIRDLVKTLVAS